MIARAVWVLFALASVNLATFALGGDLNPPEAPAPTPGPEPRIAINTVNTPGNDDSHFRITEPGSYRLEGNLILLGDESKHGILIEASNVSVDLCGFTLDGWNPIAVPHPNSSLSGIMASGELENIAVQNGVVREWGDMGINLSNDRNTIIDGITVSGNGGRGMWTGENGVVTRCVAEGNGDDGILAGSGSSVTECAAGGNTGSGLFISTGSTILGCASRLNGGDGIQTANGCTVVNCSAYENTTMGIRVGSFSTVQGCTVRNNQGSGIFVPGNSCLIIGNMCAGNGDGDDAGIEIGVFSSSTSSRIEGNNVVSNDNIGIDVNIGGNLIVRNSASENGTNYSIVGGNDVGTIQTSPVGAGAWDNFEF